MKSIFHSTSSSLRDGREPGWQSVADYRQPLLLFIGSRFKSLSAQDREDLVHSILLEIKEKLHKEYRRERGRFRQFLCGVVRNRVLAHFKKHKREQLCDAEFFEEARLREEVWVHVEIVAEAFGAIRRWLEQQSGTEALKQIAVFSRRLSRGETQADIAAAEKLPPHTVKRWLKEARETITADLLRNTLDLPDEKLAGLDLNRMAQAVLRAFPRRGKRTEALASLIADPALRDALLQWIAHFEHAVQHAAHQDAADGVELQRGLEALLAE